jgi:small subunit ribosomal protein S17
MTNKTGKIFKGVVTSDKMKNTIVVTLKYTKQHPKYQKIVSKNKKIYADNNLNATLGQIVRVRETRPLSKLKRFTTVEILNIKN